MSFICFLNAAASSVFCRSSLHLLPRCHSHLGPSHSLCPPACLFELVLVPLHLLQRAVQPHVLRLGLRVSRLVGPPVHAQSLLGLASSRSLAPPQPWRPTPRFSLSSATCICFTCLPTLSFSVSSDLNSPSRSFNLWPSRAPWPAPGAHPAGRGSWRARACRRCPPRVSRRTPPGRRGRTPRAGRVPGGSRHAPRCRGRG